MRNHRVVAVNRLRDFKPLNKPFNPSNYEHLFLSDEPNEAQNGLRQALHQDDFGKAHKCYPQF